MANKPQSDNARIAKNTFALYFRMLFIMVLSLYTSRVTLKYLGVEDYGIYNAVGGVVATLFFLKSTLTTAAQRFITYELGKGDEVGLRKVFANNLSVHLILSGIVLLLGETIGLWFLNCKMNIPADRMTAANVVFQCSLGSFILTLINVPYSGLIIAHERMSAFAYLSIVEAVLKLLIVYLLAISYYDKLILYSLLWLLVCLIIQAVYCIYSFRTFKESRILPQVDRNQFKNLLSFSSYNLCVFFANMLADQGVNILLNLQFGPIANAARGISVQVNNALTGFTNNFGTAINPQITKNYASGNMSRMWTLVAYGNRISFFLILLLSAPVFFKIDSILNLWLEEVPLHSGIFIQLMILANLSMMPVRTFYTAIAASGKIKVYQITLGLFRLLILPACWLAINYILEQPYIVYYVILIFEILGTLLRLYIMRSQFEDFSMIGYVSKVIVPCLFVGLCVFGLAGVESMLFPDALGGLLAYVLCCCTTAAIIIYLIGLDKKERNLITDFFIRKIQKKQ